VEAGLLYIGGYREDGGSKYPEGGLPDSCLACGDDRITEEAHVYNRATCGVTRTLAGSAFVKLDEDVWVGCVTLCPTCHRLTHYLNPFTHSRAGALYSADVLAHLGKVELSLELLHQRRYRSEAERLPRRMYPPTSGSEAWRLDIVRNKRTRRSLLAWFKRERRRIDSEAKDLQDLWSAWESVLLGPVNRMGCRLPSPPHPLQVRLVRRYHQCQGDPTSSYCVKPDCPYWGRKEGE